MSINTNPNTNPNTKAPETCQLFPEMVKAFAAVHEAEENRHAWHAVAVDEMKKVKILHRAQKQIDPETPDWGVMLDAIRAQYEETEDNGDTPETLEPDEDTEDQNV